MTKIQVLSNYVAGLIWLFFPDIFVSLRECWLIKSDHCLKKHKEDTKKIQRRTTGLAVYTIIFLSFFAATSLVYADDDTNATGKVFMGIKYGNQDIDMQTQFTAKIGYERTKYEETEINATLGTRSDKKVVEPRVESFFLTLQYNFN